MYRRLCHFTATMAAAVLVLSGCGGAVFGQSGVYRARWADRDLIGRWTDASGRQLEDGTTASNGILVVRSYAGSTTCENDGVTVFLELARPVGRPLDTNKGITEEMVPRFVRDTSGSLLKTYGSSDLDAELPASAKPTGFLLNGNTIHVAADGRALFVTRVTQKVERWPRLQPQQGCPS